MQPWGTLVILNPLVYYCKQLPSRPVCREWGWYQKCSRRCTRLLVKVSWLSVVCFSKTTSLKMSLIKLINTTNIQSYFTTKKPCNGLVLRIVFDNGSTQLFIAVTFQQMSWSKSACNTIRRIRVFNSCWMIWDFQYIC